MSARADSYPAEATFNIADANRDGSITYLEWKQLIHASAAAFSGQAAVCFERSRLKVFGALDRNRDGQVSLEEWRSAGARHYDPNLPSCLK